MPAAFAKAPRLALALLLAAEACGLAACSPHHRPGTAPSAKPSASAAAPDENARTQDGWLGVSYIVPAGFTLLHPEQGTASADAKAKKVTNPSAEFQLPGPHQFMKTFLHIMRFTEVPTEAANSPRTESQALVDKLAEDVTSRDPSKVIRVEHVSWGGPGFPAVADIAHLRNPIADEAKRSKPGQQFNTDDEFISYFAILGKNGEPRWLVMGSVVTPPDGWTSQAAADAFDSFARSVRPLPN